jgi:3-hydroxy-9,10-secoandrosta-1,3,5(10)-triene-9,17-dione monooxygenase
MAVATLKAHRTEDVLPSSTELFERAEALAAKVKPRVAETQRLRRLPDATMDDLYASGLLRVLQPRCYGGYEADWPTHLHIGQIIARTCPSTAWIQCVVGTHAWVASRFSAALQGDIWGKDQDVLLVTAVAGGSNVDIESVDGGYVVTGRWRFASGVDHAKWAIVGAMPNDPKRRAEHDFVQLALPRADFAIDDTWHTAGLRGTGSNDIVIEKKFVPMHRTLSRKVMRAAPTPDSLRHPGYVNHVPFSPYFATIVLGPLIGAAKGAMDAYIGITKKRVGAMFGEQIAEQIPVQSRIGESCAEIRAADLLVKRIIDELHVSGSRGQVPTRDEWLKHRADGAFAARLCVTAIDRMFRHMGASGLTDGNPVRRYLEDLQAISSHIGIQWDNNMTPFGRWALGVPTQLPEVDATPEGSIDLY